MLVILGVGCLAAAGVIWGIHSYEEARAAKDAENLLTELNHEIELRAEQAVYETVKVEESPQGESAQINWNGYDLMGVLRIPCLDLELPVMSTWDYDLVKISPCRYSGSVEENDLILLAHNYKRHFGPLKKLELGDELQITDVDGGVTAYTVAQLETLKNTELDRLTSSAHPLTLFTCTSGGQARLVVRCDRLQTAEE